MSIKRFIIIRYWDHANERQEFKTRRAAEKQYEWTVNTYKKYPGSTRKIELVREGKCPELLARTLIQETTKQEETIKP